MWSLLCHSMCSCGQELDIWLEYVRDEAQTKIFERVSQISLQTAISEMPKLTVLFSKIRWIQSSRQLCGKFRIVWIIRDVRLSPCNLPFEPSYVLHTYCKCYGNIQIVGFSIIYPWAIPFRTPLKRFHRKLFHQITAAHTSERLARFMEVFRPNNVRLLFEA